MAEGHSVYVKSSAGLGSSFSDGQYSAAGADVVADAAAVWAAADIVVKIKEPIRPEWQHIRAGQTIFTYFHFAADRELTQAHLDSGATCQSAPHRFQFSAFGNSQRAEYNQAQHQLDWQNLMLIAGKK